MNTNASDPRAGAPSPDFSADAGQEEGEELGIIDFLVLEVDSAWSGRGVERLSELAEANVIRILDVEVVVRDDDGTPRLMEPSSGAAANLSGLSVFAGVSSGILDDEDAATIGDMVSPDRVGLVIVYENLWTADLAASLKSHGGHLVASGQISPEDLDAALGVEE